MPCYQIVAILLMTIIEILAGYLVYHMQQLQLVILYVLYSLNYLAFVFVLIDFFILSLNDPSDPRLKDPTYK